MEGLLQGSGGYGEAWNRGESTGEGQRGALSQEKSSGFSRFGGYLDGRVREREEMQGYFSRF